MSLCLLDEPDVLNVVHRRRRVHERDLMDDDLEDMVCQGKGISAAGPYMFTMLLIHQSIFF